MLNEYVQCIIGYIRFVLFVDMKKEDYSKVLFDKFGIVYVCCHLF